MKIKKKLGVIGVGFMGTSILQGILKNKILSASQIWIFDQDASKMQKTVKRYKVGRTASAEDLVSKADVILLAMKPQDLAAAAQSFRRALKSSQVVISILAGTPTQKLKSILGGRAKIVRAMPNLGAEVGASMTVLSSASAPALRLAENIFSGCGAVMRLEEKHMNMVTAISGSGPAYFFLLTELLAEAGIRAGISKDKSIQLAVQTARGAGLLASASSIPPAELRRRVTSKGGTTEAALKYFDSKKLSQIILDGIQAACRRGREMSRDTACRVPTE